MALKNSQYDAVMRTYEEIRSRHEAEYDERLREVREALPAYRSLENQLVRLNAEAARRGLLDPEASTADLELQIAKLRRAKISLLEEAGYPSDYTEMTYDCPLCRDTGYVDNGKCRCFRRISARILQAESAEGSSFQNMAFSDFQMSFYSDKIKDERTERSDRENAAEAFRIAVETAERVGQKSEGVIFYGNTGLGKTMLSKCMASAVLKDGKTALYFSAQELFDLLADSAFGRDPDAAESAHIIFHCDLLVIDDLGTELLNSFVETQLFRLINERQMRPCTTVISTNLDPIKDLTGRYTERIFSRLISSYRLVPLTGDDIRMKKAMTGGNL